MGKGKLGVLGGMGPQATALFYQRIIDNTAAVTDQEHLPALVLSDTQMPDRTAALLSREVEEVKARLLADARLLESWGASAIAIPCNTSHAFVPWLGEQLSVPIVNMIAETAAALKAQGARRVGILATDGTLRAGLYHAACREAGIQALSPPDHIQALVMEVIYGQVKGGRPVDRGHLEAITAALDGMGCDRGVLACTELSVCRDLFRPGFFLDAMDVLARQCVEVCGYPLACQMA